MSSGVYEDPGDLTPRAPGHRPGLSDREAIAELLEFEKSWSGRAQHDGAKAAAIRERYGVSPVRYYQRLLSVVQTPVALEVDPVTCRVVREAADRRAVLSRSRGGLS